MIDQTCLLKNEPVILQKTEAMYWEEFHKSNNILGRHCAQIVLEVATCSS